MGEHAGKRRTEGGRAKIRGGMAVSACLALLPAYGLALLPRGAPFTLIGSLMLAHAVGLVLCIRSAWPRASPPTRSALLAGALVVFLCLGAATAFRGRDRGASLELHIQLGLLVLVGSWCVKERRRPMRLAIGLCAGLLAILAPLRGKAGAQSIDLPYESHSVYEFLTATVPDQSRVSHFPSARQAKGSTVASCAGSGCHSPADCTGGALTHGRGERAPYEAALRSFSTRNGAESAAWCEGCHRPSRLDTPKHAAVRIECTDCHGAVETGPAYGAGSLRVLAAPSRSEIELEARIAPAQHARRWSVGAVSAGGRLCAGCHRKGMSLAQNGFHYIMLSDEFGDWQASPYSGESIFHAGAARTVRSCVACHRDRPASRQQGLLLDSFMRLPTRSGSMPVPAEVGLDAYAGREVWLDVTVSNAAIGHTFPTGIPSARGAWLDVELADAEGRILRTQAAGPRTVWNTILTDPSRAPVRRWELDRATGFGPTRRIPAGGADLARFQLKLPDRGVGRMSIRMHRHARYGEATDQVLAERTIYPGAAPINVPGRWRSYGEALATVRDYPLAVRVLHEALRGGAMPGHADEANLALGQVFLAQGDLPAALSAFRAAARSGSRDRGLAWEAAVERRAGQPDRAAAIFGELLRRYPRDVRLRMEMGLTELARLRNAESGRQFSAALAVDPLNAAAHYQLMLSRQRLNELTEARREEVLYDVLLPLGPAPDLLRPTAPVTVTRLQLLP